MDTDRAVVRKLHQLSVSNDNSAIIKAETEILQNLLKASGYFPAEAPSNGIFGAGTKEAVQSFQAKNGLDATGVVNRQTWAKLWFEPLDNILIVDNTPSPAPFRRLTEADYQQAATRLGISVKAVKAVAQVEASGSGFLPSGKPKILFERHWFSNLTQGRFNSTHSDISNRKPGGYVGGEGEWNRLNRAIALNRVAALHSASWGMFQILGANFRSAGFTSVDNFVNTMNLSEGEHLKAFVNFIIKTGAAQHLERLDWRRFALSYNGPSAIKNGYDRKMAAAFARL